MNRPLPNIIFMCLMFLLPSTVPGTALAGSLDFHLVFADAELLEQGCPVVYKGVKIGTVRDVDFDEKGDVEVTVRIKGKYSKVVYREASFIIEPYERGSEGKSYIQLRIKDAEADKRTRITKGDRIVVDSAWSSKLNEVAAEISSWFKRNSKLLIDDSKEFSVSPEGRELKKSLQALAHHAREGGNAQFKKFMEDDFPKIQEEAEALRDQIGKDGTMEEAEDFWQDFKEWSEEMIDEAKKELSESKK
jgi:sporulation protein YlmC with PRC-barrel domain